MDDEIDSSEVFAEFLKIKNEEEARITISSIRLMGGNNSAYRMNVNGSASSLVNNIEIPISSHALLNSEDHEKSSRT